VLKVDAISWSVCLSCSFYTRDQSSSLRDGVHPWLAAWRHMVGLFRAVRIDVRDKGLSDGHSSGWFSSSKWLIFLRHTRLVK